MKPLEDIVGEDLGRFAMSPESLLVLPGTPGFERARSFFDDHPERSLSVPESRAFMHCLVRAVRPSLFVEIGGVTQGEGFSLPMRRRVRVPIRANRRDSSFVVAR